MTYCIRGKIKDDNYADNLILTLTADPKACIRRVQFVPIQQSSFDSPSNYLGINLCFRIIFSLHYCSKTRLIMIMIE